MAEPTTTTQLDDLLSQIRRGETVTAFYDRRGRSCEVCTIDGRSCYVLYDPVSDDIVSVYPETDDKILFYEEWRERHRLEAL